MNTMKKIIIALVFFSFLSGLACIGNQTATAIKLIKIHKQSIEVMR